MSQMTVESVKARKRELEKDILKKLNEFSAETGMFVQSVELVAENRFDQSGFKLEARIIKAVSIHTEL